MPMKPFNDTDDYKHLHIFHTEGVFTSADIDITTLPDDYHPYIIWGSTAGAFDAISEDLNSTMQKTGFYITKTVLPLQSETPTLLKPADILHSDRPFSMESFFGIKESIDLQISKADSKRRAQTGEETHTRSAAEKREEAFVADALLDVSQLSAEQFSELKDNYWHDILPESDTEKYPTPEDIPDQVILEHYKHTTFTPDDFSAPDKHHTAAAER